MKREKVEPIESILPVDSGYYDPASRSISDERNGVQQVVVVVDGAVYSDMKRKLSAWSAVNRRLRRDPEASPKFLGLPPIDS